MIKTILNLVILNLIQVILTFTLIVLLSSCAPPSSSDQLWMYSLESLPHVEGYSRAGVFTINGKLYVQKCDTGGNQIWMRYNEETHTWRQSRYNSLGCTESTHATGPSEG